MRNASPDGALGTDAAPDVESSADAYDDAFPDVHQMQDAAVDDARALPCVPAFSAGLKSSVYVSLAAMATGDFDGDGRTDLVTSAGAMHMLRGNGDGSFSNFNRRRYRTTNEPLAVAAADFDGDGALDVITADDVSVTWYPGNGDGTLGSPISSPAGSTPWNVSIADIDKNGRLDLVVGSDRANEVAFLSGRGDGTFDPPFAYATSAVVYGTVIADVDGDGVLDMVVNSESTLTLRLGNGDGTFQAERGLALGAAPVLLDVNGDGRLDLVYGRVADVGVQLATGGGAFAPALTVTLPEGTPGPSFLLGGDVNGDGRADVTYIAVDGRTLEGVIGVAYGYGDGTFHAATITTVQTTPRFVSGDFNGDGRLDFVVSGGNCVIALLNMGCSG